MKILECNLCGNCLSCPYLSKYGYPKEIYLKKDSSVFICTNCGLCDRLCPLEIHPSFALYSLKEQLINENRLTPENLNAINSARKFAKTMSSFPFYHLDFRETVFFPGCALISQGSQIVYGIKNWLEERLKEKIGIILHCCGDPMYQNGDTSYLSSFAERLREKIENCGISKIIFACSNCKKIFKKCISGFETVHISELIVEADIKELGKDFILHHPCPNFKNEEIKDSIDKNFGKGAIDIMETPLCCGLGGAANKIDKDVAQGFLSKIKDTAKEKSILTSCMGCKNRFLKNGIKAKHIYEEITGIDINKPTGENTNWSNRLIVSLKAKVNFKKLLVFFLILIGSIYLYNMQKSGIITIDRVFNFVKTSKYLAPLIYILIYAIGPSLFFPSLILTIIAGMLWGPLWGVVFAITGATIGCSVPFLLARYMLHENVKRLFGLKRWERLKNLVEKDGWKVVAFTRIIPLFPFPVLNYLFGITPIKFWHYVSASFLFMLPACIAYVYFGSGIFELIAKGNFMSLINAVILISIVLLLPFLFRKKIK